MIPKLCRVDLTRNVVAYESLPDDYVQYGGRALSARILLQESDPRCDPLGRSSFLVLATGLLAGTPGPAVHRISIGGKSPLTGGIKESNAGGMTALRLSQIGIKAVVITGQFVGKVPLVLHLSESGGELVPMREIAFLGVYETGELLKERFGGGCGMAIIGPVGERRFRAASVAHMDKDGSPSRFSARGGLGAVMGSKGLKAIVVERGTHKVDLHDKRVFSQAVKEFLEVTRATPKTGEMFPKYGTPALVQIINEVGALPTRNYSSGRFELVDEIDGETVYQNITLRGGKGNPTHACMPGCPVRCSNVYPDKDGNALVSPLEYETIAMLGANCGIGNLDQIAELNRMCNDFGLDTIETGGALAVAMEAGVLRFGSFEDARQALNKVRDNEILGRIIANGVRVTGEVLGVWRVPQVKGQGMSGYDPRGTKTVGVTFSLSPMGADHTGGTGVTTPHVDRLSPNGHVDNSRQLNFLYAGVDSIGICIIASEAVTDKPTIMDRLLRGTYGWSPGGDVFRTLGRECLKMEREFNLKAGFSKVHDDVPEFMREEPLPPHNCVFDVPREEMEKFYNF